MLCLILIGELGEEFSYEFRDAGVMPFGVSSSPFCGLVIECDVESFLWHGSSVRIVSNERYAWMVGRSMG